MDIKILYEDEMIIVVEKPPKIPSQKDLSGDNDLMMLLNREYLGLIHRLDRPVGGVMVYGKDKSATSYLSKGIRDGAFHKEYLVVVCGIPKKNEGEIRDYLLKESITNTSTVVLPEDEGSKEAVLKYKLEKTIVTQEYGDLSLLLITLITGRHHQIRVQLSNIGLPIWGDTKYNENFKNNKEWTQIALWSYRIKFRHPKGKKVSFTSYPYDEFPWNIFRIGGHIWK